MLALVTQCRMKEAEAGARARAAQERIEKLQVGGWGLGVEGWGFRVWGLGFRVWGLGYGTLNHKPIAGGGCPRA